MRMRTVMVNHRSGVCFPSIMCDLRDLRVTTPKDLTTALVKEDLKATGELTARVRFC